MILNESFNQKEFTNWINSFLPDFSQDVRNVDVSKSFQGIKSIQTIGESSLGVRVYIIETEQDPSRRKVSLAKESFTLLRDYGTPNAIIAYHCGDSTFWRLSLLTSTLSWDEGKINKKLSNPKRQSYILGTKAKVKTPHQYLVAKGSVIDLRELKSRFSLEVVNKEFYKEISHSFINLVGGTLTKGKSKEVVKSQLKLPSVGDHSQTAQEFVVRLIGRVIFSWFLREKKSSAGHSLMPHDLLSLDAARSAGDYYHTILEPIFFEVLNKKINSRKETYTVKPFSDIPYLNGGLFAPHDDDHYSYNDGKQAINHNLVVIPDSWFISFFEILETYNFTIDENTSFDEELSIDPEMLGRIFENLLAEINPETGESARKSTGSYYTPRVIVDYMVDESLYLYLKDKTSISESKLRSVISYDLDDDSTNPLTEEEKGKITQALQTVKILDPACGSGAFPIGALQKIVFILQQIDPHGQIWFNKQIQNTSIELRRLIQKEFEEKNFDYLRKLGIIRENIYGVDIQPIATEISRLRCFLTLVVDQRVDDTLPNRGIEPLPNLEFKFVTANTLIGLPQFAESNNKGQVSLIDNRENIDRLKKIITTYFNADIDEKKDLKFEFANLQKRIYKDLEREYGWSGIAKADLTRKLTDWEPFSHKATDWFDPEWMFGLKDGFNIVIANPPYVDSETMVKDPNSQREVYKDIYITAKGNWDLYIPFLELGNKLLSQNGIASFITPNKWFCIGYGSSIRDLLARRIIRVGNCNDITVFEAGNSPVITIFGKDEVDDKVLVDSFDEEYNVNTLNFERTNLKQNFGILLSKNLKLIKKIRSCGNTVDVFYKAANPCSVSEAYDLKPMLIELSDNKSGEKYFKFVNTGTIDPFVSLWESKTTTYLKSKFQKPIVLQSTLKDKFPKRFSQMNQPKIIISGMRHFESFLDSKGEYLAGKSTEILVQKGKYSLVSILGILNSKLIRFYIKEVYSVLGIGGGINFTSDLINGLPIPNLECIDIRKLESLTENVINISNIHTSQGSSNVVVDKARISLDNEIYKLYQLTEEEIKLVERATQ